jgi:chromosomal replication initiation ATPase DnaA
VSACRRADTQSKSARPDAPWHQQPAASDRLARHRDNEYALRRAPDTRQYVSASTGCGKTFLACALAHQACRQGLSALYVRAPRLFDELGLCHADGSFRRRLAAIAKVHVLVIDDFAIAPIGARERSDLLELLDDRVAVRSTLITSQILWAAAHNNCNAESSFTRSPSSEAPLPSQF